MSDKTDAPAAASGPLSRLDSHVIQSGREAFELGYSTIGSLLNQILEEQGYGCRIKVDESAAWSEGRLRRAWQVMRNFFSACRQCDPPFEEDHEIVVWTLGSPDGDCDNQLPVACWNSIPDENYIRHGLLALRANTWTSQSDWERCVVQPIESNGRVWRKWFEGLLYGVMPVLSHRQYGLLQAMFELSATSPESRITLAEAVRVAEGNSADFVHFKHDCSALRKLGLIDTASGGAGGCWLTNKGEQTAQRLAKTG